MSHLEKLTLTNKLSRLLMIVDVHSLKEDIMLMVTLTVTIFLTACRVDVISIRFRLIWNIFSPL